MIPQPSRPSQADSDDTIEVGRLVDILMSGKWLILGTTLTAGLLGMAYVQLATPIYQADALIQVEPERNGLLAVEALGMPEESNVEAEIRLFQSRMVLGRAVDERGLEIVVEPKRFALIGGYISRRANPLSDPAEPFLGLEGYAWGGEHVDVPQLMVPEHWRGQPLTLRAEQGGGYTVLDSEGQALVRGEVGVPAVSADGGVQLFVRDLRAHPGTEFSLQRQSRQAAIGGLRGGLSVAEAGRGSAIINLSLEGPDRIAIQQTLDAVANAFVRQNVERRSLEAAQRISFLEDQLPAVRQDLEEAEERFNRFRQDNEAFDLTAEGQSLLGQVVDLEAQLAELELHRSELRQSYASQHPRIIALNDKVRQLREMREEFDSRIRRLPDSQQELLRLKREVDVGTALYTAMLNQAQELRVVRAGTVGNVRVVDEAVSTAYPVSPQKGMVTGASIVLGLILGVFGVFAHRMFHRGIADPSELEDRFGISCYAVVPQSNRFERLRRRAARQKGPPPILARDLPDEPAVESLRSLRTSLHFALMNQQRRVVAITGPSPSIGKTFLSLNLGYLLAQAGRRVIVVDADMRRGHMHEYLDTSRAPGLSDVISGKVRRWREAVHCLNGTELHFMSTGVVPPNPSELLMTAAFDTLLSQLEAEYDLVIVDTVPILAATDGVLVGARAGAVFMVVRAGVNRPAEFEQAIKRMQRDGVTVSGFVLNGLPRTSQQGGYGGYYHYQYSYQPR